MVRRSVKRTAILVTLVACSLGAGVPSATAASAGSCPSSFESVSTGKWGDEGRAIDKNGNGRLCQKLLPDGVSYNVIDDKV